MNYDFVLPIVLVVVGMSLTACGTVQTSQPSSNEITETALKNSPEIASASVSGQAELVVSRVFAMPTRLKSRISIDGKEVGRLGNGEYLRVPISEGTHKIRLHYNKLSLQKGDKIDLNVEPGKVYAFNIDSGFVGHSNTDYGNNIRVDVRLVQTSSDSAMTCCKLVSK